MLRVNDDGSMSITRGEYGEFEVELENIATSSDYVMDAEDSLEFSVAKEVCDKNYVIHKTVKGSNVIALDPADTASVPCGRYVYDIRLILADGKPLAIVDPTLFEVKCGVTK